MQALALLVEKQNLEAKLKFTEAQIQENRCGKQKLQTVLLMIEELKQLPPYLKASQPAIALVEQLHQDVKEKNLKADQMLQRFQQKPWFIQSKSNSKSTFIWNFSLITKRFRIFFII